MSSPREGFEKRVFSRGQVVCVFGGSLGDEGKGKIVSLFREVDRVATATGGGNAGHTVYHEGHKLALHELPGGSIIYKARLYLGQGRVINIPDLRAEMLELEAAGIPLGNKIVIAGNAHLIFDNLQRSLDTYIEEIKAKKVGTTKKGIGPAYALKALRTSITVNMLLFNPTRVEEFVSANIALFPHLSLSALNDEIKTAKFLLEDLIQKGFISIDTTNMLLNHERQAGKRVLVEASQSALLAIDGGMYPYCTSSDTTVNGIQTGLNIPQIDTTIAVVKAIKSKVGGGYFPTKFEDESFAESYRVVSGEYGATTKRPRDVGYFDCVETRRVLATNKVDVLCITKADVLAQIPKLQFAKQYLTRTADELFIDTFPAQEAGYSDLSVQWSDSYHTPENICGLQDPDQLPSSYREYFDGLLDTLEFKGKVVLGTGPERNDFLIYR